jgi:hypothetical protein
VLVVRQITLRTPIPLCLEILLGFSLLFMQLANEMTIHEHSPPEERMALPF